MKKIYIAPIAGVTDYTFRGILEDFKPDLIFTEIGECKCTFSFK